SWSVYMYKLYRISLSDRRTRVSEAYEPCISDYTTRAVRQEQGDNHSRSRAPTCSSSPQSGLRAVRALYLVRTRRIILDRSPRVGQDLWRMRLRKVAQSALAIACLETKCMRRARVGSLAADSKFLPHSAGNRLGRLLS